MENYPESREYVTRPVYPYTTGIIIATIACFILGLIMMWFVPMLGVILMIATLVLSIVAIAKGAKVFGIIMLLVAVLVGAPMSCGILGAKFWSDPENRQMIDEQIEKAQQQGGIREDIADRVENVTNDPMLNRQAVRTEEVREAVTEGDMDRAGNAAEDMKEEVKTEIDETN